MHPASGASLGSASSSASLLNIGLVQSPGVNHSSHGPFSAGHLLRSRGSIGSFDKQGSRRPISLAENTQNAGQTVNKFGTLPAQKWSNKNKVGLSKIAVFYDVAVDKQSCHAFIFVVANGTLLTWKFVYKGRIN